MSTNSQKTQLSEVHVALSTTPSATEAPTIHPKVIEESEDDDISEEEELHEEEEAVQSDTEAPKQDATSTGTTEEPHSFTTAISKKTRQHNFTRTQENDLLLSTFEALSAYRRPSSKPSLVRKLEAIDNALALLNSLKEQLTKSGEPASKSSSAPSASSISTTMPKLRKSQKTSATIPSTTSSDKKRPLKDKQPEKPPSSAYVLYSHERRSKLQADDEKASNQAIRAKLEAEWKAISPARREIYEAKFAQLAPPSDKLLASQFPSPDLAGISRKQILPASILTSTDLKRPESLQKPQLLPTHSTSTPKPDSDKESFEWKMSLNPRLGSIANSETLTKWLNCDSKFEALISLKIPQIPISAVHLSRCGNRLAFCDANWTYIYRINMDDAKGSNARPRIESDCVVETKFADVRTRSICLSHDGNFLFTSDSELLIRKWNLEKRELDSAALGHSEPVFAMSLSADGKTLATGSSDRRIILWDAENLSSAPRQVFGAIEGNKKVGPFEGVLALEFSPNGRFLACGSADSHIRVWNCETALLEFRFDGHSSPILSLAWHPTLPILTTTSIDCTVRQWSLDDAVTAPSFSTVSNIPLASKFDPVTGSILWTCGKDKLLRLWALPSPNSTTEATQSSKAPIETAAMVVGHKATILDLSVAQLKEKVILASVAGDGECTLWTYYSM
jgi:WD40 repeat protein